MDSATKEQLRRAGIEYHEDAGKCFRKNVGLHFSQDGGVAVINVGGHTRMIQDWAYEGQNAVLEIYSVAAALVSGADETFTEIEEEEEEEEE